MKYLTRGALNDGYQKVTGDFYGNETLTEKNLLLSKHRKYLMNEGFSVLNNLIANTGILDFRIKVLNPCITLSNR